MALIIMGVMAIASTAALKLALSGSQIALGLRTSNLALQAAESGLRWCELQTRLTIAGVPNLPVVPRPPQAGALLWETQATFTANAVTVPAAVLNGLGLVNFPVLPQCVSEETKLDYNPDPTAGRTFTITVRGFSPDYSRGAGDTSGGEVWLQSQLYLP